MITMTCTVNLVEPWTPEPRVIEMALAPAEEPTSWPLRGHVKRAEFDPSLSGWECEVSPRHQGVTGPLRSGITVAVGVRATPSDRWTYLGFGRAKVE
jgi:hypothetical protein